MDPQMKNIPKILEIYLKISQYPILGHRIRALMREEIFARGVITREQFDQEVKGKAIISQKREGLSDPFSQEPTQIWQERVAQIRDHMTDFYFAYNLPHTLFEEIVHQVLSERVPDQEVTLSFNPEMAPRNILLAQAKKFSMLPEKQRSLVSHHLKEMNVVLIKSLISDQLKFVQLARGFLDPSDFELINERRIGEGKIGGKAAGMLLAWKILQQECDAETNTCTHVVIPDSYFIGADVFYDFHAINNFDQFINQKYKSEEDIREEYPHIRDAYVKGRFPDEVKRRLTRLLVEVGNTPLIVRSSSLLEDNFGFSFAGKYDSFFCPNQGSLEDNLNVLTQAISRVYASVLSPDALLYRQRMGLVDYDERMAILIQKVQGQKYGHYFFPSLAGVGFSRNPFRWSRRIRPEGGLLRLVLGLGTRAVDRVASDYPRMVALSHPQLRPEADPREIRRYSQHFVDVIDLETNDFKTLPVDDVLGLDYPNIRLIASQDKGDYLQPIYATGLSGKDDLVLTFDKLLKNANFVGLMRTVLQKLEHNYGRPVDVEFTVEITSDYPPNFILHLLQCRPQSRYEAGGHIHIPEVSPQDIVFRSQRMVPRGRVNAIRYIVYVDPTQYSHAPDRTTQLEIARVIGRLNKRLEKECFILMGPGRWGSTNVELGVKVSYADIYNTRALVEIAQSRDGNTLEVSYGTHFFQDLVEAHIYPLPLYPDAPGTIFDRAFFEDAQNVLGELLPEDASIGNFVKVIDVPASTEGRYMDLVMDDEQDEALAYLHWK